MKNMETRDSAVIYASTLDQIRTLYNTSPELAGELAISAIEMLLCDDISSDNVIIKAMLMPTKAINDNNVQKREIKIQNAKMKKKIDQKLEIIADMYNRGATQAKIAERIGTSQQTISNRLILIRTEYPELLQENHNNTSKKFVQNGTSNLQVVQDSTNKSLVQDSTNNLQVVQTVQDCKNGINGNINKVLEETQKKEVEKPYFDF